MQIFFRDPDDKALFEAEWAPKVKTPKSQGNGEPSTNHAEENESAQRYEIYDSQEGMRLGKDKPQSYDHEQARIDRAERLECFCIHKSHAIVTHEEFLTRRENRDTCTWR